MDMAESTQRRGLAVLGVSFVLGSVVLAGAFWRPTIPSAERQESPLLVVDAPVELPKVEYEPATTPVVAPSVRQVGNAITPTAGPAVSPTAAPGVAFNYRYAFRLPAERIAQVQEQHARACEQLGTSRCRITGLRFRVVNDRDVEAMIVFKLEPGIARRFGRQGAELVARSEGMLIDSEISGTDVGTTSRAAGRSIAEMSEELARIEARLRERGLTAAERTNLEYQAQQLRQSIRGQQANREEQQESLATTPMAFTYGSGDLVPNLDTRPSFGRSAARAWDNFIEGVGILFIIAVTLLPWALLGLLGWGAFVLARRRWTGRRGDTEAAPPLAAPAFS
jgi:hypothetical protein